MPSVLIRRPLGLRRPRRLWIPSLTAPSGLDPAIGGAADPNMVMSPGNWLVNGTTSLISINQGAYLKLTFNDPDIGARFDVSAIQAAGLWTVGSPRITWSIDHGDIQNRYLSAMTGPSGGVVHTSLGSSLGGGQHEIMLWIREIYSTSAWDGDTALRFLTFTRGDGVTSLSATSEHPYRQPDQAIFFGDSITVQDSVDSSSEQHLPPSVAAALDCECGIVAWGGHSYQGGPGDIVGFHSTTDAAASSWRWLYAGQARSFTGIKYVFVNEGTNGTVAQATVEDFINDFLADSPSTTTLFMMVPFGGFGRAAITAAVSAVGSSRVHLIDIAPTAASNGLREPQLGLEGTGSAPSFRSINSDTLHPKTLAAMELATRVTALTKDALAPVGGGTGGRRRVW